MPTPLHPQAKFDPVPPDLDLPGLVDRTPNFKWVQRVSRTQIRNLGYQEFEKLVQIHVIAGGKPLVIDGWDAVLPQWLFNVDWLEKTYDKKQENVRDIPAATDIPMTTGHYLRSMKQLANQWTPHTFRDERRQRLYLKDIDCPPEWREALQRVIHPSLFYLNENVNATGGNERQDDDIFRSEATAAPAGDLMSSLPGEMRAENLMCYIGHEGTYTPAHREMCASLGQNIMVEASSDGDGENAGSSIWFMTESKDREVVREYFLSMLGHDIEIEKHFAQINAWKKAPFDVYIVEQRAGDFILVPPLAAHQVWNRGTRTIKVAWNRTTVETLDLALHEALPKARLVCRDEQYKNKAIIYFTLQKYFGQLREMEENAEMTQMSFMGIGHEIVRNSPRARQLAGEFKQLFGLFTEILVDEVFAFKEKDVEFLPFDSCVTCSYCRSNIFNRFLTCKHCIRTLDDGGEDAYDVCMECYAMGRSCACLSGLQWCEQWSWLELVDSYEIWRAMVIINDGYIDVQTSPQPFEVARQKSGKKSVAQICQEALRRRPWKDITKPEREKTPSDSEPGDGEEKTKKKPKRKKKKGEVRRCHVCCHKDYSYRVHECTNPECTEGYCYGVLYRAFDMMPQTVLEDEYWQCPKCLGICICGSCRRSGNTNAYTPKNTLLGHDTRPIADDRSVEALVDFRVHNLSWLKAVGEESRSKDSRRMQRLREQADNAKAQDQTQQVEAEQAMQGENGAPNMASAETSTETSAVNGYGDQSEVLGQQPSALEDYDSDRETNEADKEAGLSENAAGSMGMSGTGDPGLSSYPDPSLLVRQRIGMGYYEQDDTPDKILFDPYQAPSADSMRLSEPDVPEFVKKSIRAAKRKARRENEDPDFVIGKSHHKRPRLAHQADLLESMDPALFDRPATPEAAVCDAVEKSGTQPHQPSETGQNRTERVSQKRHSTPRFSASEVTLRHAKPMTSYVEVEDALELEDSEDYVTAPRTMERSDTQASEAAMYVPAAGESPAPEVVRQFKVHKRRGRPPKRLSVAGTASREVSSTLTPTAALDEGGMGTGKRGRGRPRKSAPLAAMEPDDGEGTGEGSRYGRGGDTEDSVAVEELEAQEVIEVVGQANADAADGSASRGRTRRSGVTTIAAAAAEMEEPDSKADQPSQPEPVASHEGSVQAKRRRGRPRQTEAMGRDLATTSDKSPAASQQFMSMAERMALKGKGFRIGERKRRNDDASAGGAGDVAPRGEGPGSAANPGRSAKRWAATPARDGARGGPSRSASPGAQDDGAAKQETAPVSGETAPVSRPTVVRLADVEQEEDGQDGSWSSGTSSGDQEDIPSGRHSPGKPRGRGRGRGRARGVRLGAVLSDGWRC